MKFINSLFQKLINLYYKFCIKKNRELYINLQNYLNKTESKGCSFSDYGILYKTIRLWKPLEVLECGTGVSTLIIAHALMQNKIETGQQGRVTSMEECEPWFNMAQNLLPDVYQNYVDFKLSSTIEDQYSIFRGVRYKDVPKRDYDFVFVDGPNYNSPNDGASTFDFDYINILRNSNHPVGCLIDKRVSTVFVLQQLLGLEKVKYNAILGLGIIRPLTCKDLGNIHNTISSLNFKKSFRIFGNSKLFVSSNQ